MTADRTIPTVFAVMFVVCAIPAALYFRKLPAAELTVSEKEIAGFSSKPVSIAPPPPLVTFSGVACPVSAAQKPVAIGIEKSSAKEPASSPSPAIWKKAPARSLASLPVLSMISYDESTKSAIIDNRIVSEGSKLAGGGVIVKIEQARVLIRKNGRDLWLTIDQ
jgi:hypothetical protein